MLSLQTLQWRESWWLLLAICPLALFLLARLQRHLRQSHYADRQLLPWVIASYQRGTFYTYLRLLANGLAWCCFAIAMAGPRIADKIYQTVPSAYNEVIIALDVSPSMVAKDILPSRLQRARLELLDFLTIAEQTRIGLTVFAAHPHLVSPLTHDRAALRHYLDALTTPLLPTAGSNIDAALLFAASHFTEKSNVARAILLISDGHFAEPTAQTSRQNVIDILKQRNIHVYSLGIGTLQGQAIVSQLDPRYTQTQTSISRLERESLQQLATLTNGLYTDVSDSDSDWQQLYDHGMALLAPSDGKPFTGNSKILWHDLYHIPLVLAFLFFVLSLVVPSSTTGKTRNSVLSTLTLILVTFTACDNTTLNAAEIRYDDAYNLYLQQQYKQAADLFSRLPGYEARLGEASALYQQADYPAARNMYIQAVLAAANDQQRATALFNLGNTFYQLKEFIQAEKIYRDVLHYEPEHAGALHNIPHAQQQHRLQLAEEALTYRSGRGPRTGRAAENLDLTNTQVSLGESSSKSEFILPSTDDLSSTTANIIEQATLASQQVENGSDTDWTYAVNTTNELITAQQNLPFTETFVWQRLFEQEEGFAAPQLFPHALPGVAPW